MSKESGLAGTPYEGGVPDDESFGLDEEDIREKYSYANSVTAKLNKLGFHMQPQPSVDSDMARVIGTLSEGEYFDGRLPMSLKNLSLEEISDLHVLMSNWIHYVTSALNEVIVARSEATQKKEAIWSMVRMKHLKDAKKHLGVNLTDQRQSDLARYDLRFVEENQRYAELTALRDCIEALLKVSEQNASVVSREITRREVSANAEARSRGFGEGSGRPPRGGRTMHEAGEAKPRRGIRPRK